MIRFFTNREMSEKLGINLAKWKRWSRDLLPPDPLGGLQSGYARQYNPADAFSVYLGGHLIGELKYTIPETKQILADLHDWLLRSGFLFEPSPSGSNPEIQHRVRAYQIFIQPKTEPAGPYEFHYIIRGIIKTDRTDYEGFPAIQELYSETIASEGQALPPPYLWESVKLINISAVYNRFVKLLGVQNG